MALLKVERIQGEMIQLWDFNLKLNELTKIALWSGPRNISTAMMYSFANRLDTKVVDEPLFGSFLHLSGVNRPSRAEVLLTMELDHKVVIDKLVNPSINSAVYFMKHMANHLHAIDWSFTLNFKNIILTRNPKDVLLSYIKHVEKPTELDLCYKIQSDFVDFLIANKTKPLIIDAKQLLLNPKIALKKICKYAGISFSDKMLAWEAGPIQEDGVWEKYWYASVHKSTGFGKYKISKQSLPKDLEPIYEKSLMYYNNLLNIK